MKKSGNELLQFLGGLAMLTVGLFIFSQKVMVYSSFFGGSWGFGGFYMSNGIIIIPLIIGIVWMFASGGSFGSKILTGAGVLLIIAAVILSTNIRLVHVSLFEWILILVLIFGGAGLVARILLAGPGKDTDKRAYDCEIKDASHDRREIEEEIKRIKREK